MPTATRGRPGLMLVAGTPIQVFRTVVENQHNFQWFLGFMLAGSWSQDAGLRSQPRLLGEAGSLTTRPNANPFNIFCFSSSFSQQLI